MRLIDADALIKKLAENGSKLAFNDRAVFLVVSMLIANPSEIPTVDAVPVKVIEQIKWERDTAIQQLEEHGIPFCGKADVVAVVRCKDCRYYVRDNDRPPRGKCLPLNMLSVDDWYCADGERENDVFD